MAAAAMPVSMEQALRRHSDLVQECKRLQSDTHQRILVDVMQVDMGKSDFRTKSTVGIMLNDCVVDNLVVGGPAFNSRQIQPGDSILKIDGKAVSPDNILTHLVGPDIPGSTVILTVSKKGGASKDIALKRMDTVIIAGRLKLFDLFTRTKEKALDSKDESLPHMVDECIQAWTDMTISDCQREAKQAQNFHDMQEACGKSLTELETKLEELMVVATKMQNFDSDLRKEVERLKSALDVSSSKCRDLEGELKRAQEKIRELTTALDKSEREKSALAKETESMRAELDKTFGELAVKTRELSDVNHVVAELKRKIERDSEVIARLEKDVQRVTADLEQETLVRKKTERDLADERGRANQLEMSWTKAVAQRDGVQEQLEKIQAEWDKTQAALAAKNRMYDDLEDRLATSQRKVEALDHENKNLQASIEDLEKKFFREQESRIQSVRKLEAEIEVLSRERDLLQRERANCLVRLEELNQQHGKVQSTNSQLKTENEGNAVRLKELELQLKDALQIKVQLQGQVDTLNPEKFELQQRLRTTEMDLQARKDELARTVAENVKLLGSLDAEKASHLERREMLLRATEEREKAVVEKSNAMTECQTLQVELRHCKGNLESMEQRLAQANVELIKAQDALAERMERCEKLEAHERQLDEMLAQTNQEVERLREALERAQASTSEASKNEDDLRAKLNDAQLKMHEANGRAQGLEYELQDSKRSLETEIKNGADKEAALNKEQAYCRSLEKELAAFKIKYQNQETELISVRESDRHHSMTMAELEVLLNTTRSSMSAEQNKLQQDLILARLAVEQIFKAVNQKNAEVGVEKKKNEGSNENEQGAGAGQDKVEGAEIPPADGSNSEAPDKSKVMANGHAEEQSVSAHSISDMATMTCQQVHEMARKVMRLQQQNANLLNQVGQVEEVRMRADTLGRDKYLAEEELAKVRATMDIQKTDLETVRKTKARLETELQAADAKVSKLNKSLLDMEAQHAKEQLAAANQRSQLESLIAQLKSTLSDTEARVTDLTFTVEDDAQSRAFLAETIACIARIHRTVTKEEGAAKNGGVGVSVRMEKDLCVIKALDDSVAGQNARAMLPHTIQVGHVIESVDGRAVRGLGKNAVQDMLVGPVGTDVSVGARGTGEDDVPYMVTLKRFAKEDSLRYVLELTVDVCSRTSHFFHNIESLKAELSAMSADLKRKEEMLTESVRAREASNKQLMSLEQKENFFQSEKDGLQAQIDMLNMQLTSSKEQLVELAGRNDQKTEIISFSQKKIFDLENALSELQSDKQRLSDTVTKLEQLTKNMKGELKSSQESYSKDLRNLESEVEKLHAQLLKQSRTAALLMDAEKREVALKRSLEAYEQERNTYKRESTLLGADLETARRSLEARTNDFTGAQHDLASTRQRVSEIEAMCKELQNAASKTMRSEQERASELQDARLKIRLLLDAMKGSVSQWQGVGMVVRSVSGRATTIKDLRPGGSAWRSGVLNDGDFLVAVDGQNVSGMEVRDIQALILGPEGTTVNIVARSSRGGGNFSVDLIRGDAASAELSGHDEVQDAIAAANAMYSEGQSIREVVRGLVQETKRRDADLEMTLQTVQNSFEDARLSWQDVSSSLLSFTARQTPHKLVDAVDADSMSENVGEIRCNPALVSAVQTNTIKSKASLARISEIALESLRQISDSVKIRQDLQRQLLSLDKYRYDQQELEEELARMRADSEARMKGMKSDNIALAARLADAEREVQAAKAKVSDAVLSAENAKLESTSLRKQKDALLMETSGAVEAQRALHAAIRQQQASQEGVGMILRLSGDSCVVKAITPDGPASRCSQLHVGDALLSINGNDVQGKSVAQVTELFLGPTGSTVTIRAVRAMSLQDLREREAQEPYEVQLVRGKTEEGIKNTKAILEEDVTIVHKMHADAAKLTELKAEYADLEWAFKKQQDENRIFTQQLNTLKKEMEKTEKAAEFGALFKVAERERDMALQARDYMEERQRQCEKELKGKSEELHRAWEELAVAQATIQALKKRATELSEDSASPAASGAEAEAAELRARLRQAKDQLATSSSKNDAMQEELAALKSKLQEVTNERDKLKAKLGEPPLAKDMTPKATPSGTGLFSTFRELEEQAVAFVTPRSRPTTPRVTSMRSSGPSKVGIGLVITDSAPHRVTSVVPGGSAHACGLIREGDTLLTVDDTPVEDLDVAGVRSLLLGEKGIDVKEQAYSELTYLETECRSKVDLTLKRQATQDNEFPEYKVRVIRGVQSIKPRFI